MLAAYRKSRYGRFMETSTYAHTSIKLFPHKFFSNRCIKRFHPHEHIQRKFSTANKQQKNEEKSKTISIAAQVFRSHWKGGRKE